MDNVHIISFKSERLLFILSIFFMIGLVISCTDEGYAKEDAEVISESHPQPEGFVRDVQERLTELSCILEGVDSEGTQHEMECSKERCVWRTMGEEVGFCDKLDRNMACSNGISTCAEWNQFIDYSDIQLGERVN